MKSIRILFYGLILFSVSVSAQYGYGGRRTNGIPSTQQGQVKPTPEKIEEIRAEKIDSYMEKLKTELQLDELQYIAIKNEVTSSSISMTGFALV